MLFRVRQKLCIYCLLLSVQPVGDSPSWTESAIGEIFTVWAVEALIGFRFNEFSFLGNKLHLRKGSRVHSKDLNIPAWCRQASEPAEQPQQSQHSQPRLTIFPDHHLCNKTGERWDWGVPHSFQVTQSHTWETDPAGQRGGRLPALHGEGVCWSFPEAEAITSVTRAVFQQHRTRVCGSSQVSRKQGNYII